MVPLLGAGQERSLQARRINGSDRPPETDPSNGEVALPVWSTVSERSRFKSPRGGLGVDLPRQVSEGDRRSG